MIRRTAPVLAAAAVLAGCSGDGNPFAVVTDDLERARGLWEANGPDSYEYTFRWACFCPIPLVTDVVLTVQDGVLTAGRVAATGEPLEIHRLDDYRTVEGLFALVEEEIAAEPETITFRFDAVLGYPVDFFTDPDPLIADEELGFLASGLTALP